MKPFLGIKNPTAEIYGQEWLLCDELLLLKFELASKSLSFIPDPKLWFCFEKQNYIPVEQGCFVALKQPVKQALGQTLEAGQVGRVVGRNAAGDQSVVEFRTEYRPEYGFRSLEPHFYAKCVIPTENLLELQFGPECTQEMIMELSLEWSTQVSEYEIVLYKYDLSKTQGGPIQD
jgi:hypothetical protein